MPPAENEVRAQLIHIETLLDPALKAIQQATQTDDVLMGLVLIAAAARTLGFCQFPQEDMNGVATDFWRLGHQQRDPAVKDAEPPHDRHHLLHH